MTTILESPPQVTEIPEQVQQHSVTIPQHEGTGRRGTAAIVVAVLALVTALTALALTVGHPTVITTTAASSPAFPFEAYGSGSSTYVGQVPAVVSTAAANAAHTTAIVTGYGPGSTVYAAQVPASAPAVTYWEGAYGRQSVTYVEQVPVAARTHPTVAPHAAAPFE